MSDVMTMFKGVIYVMLFFSFSVTLITYTMPVSTPINSYVSSFSNVAAEADLEGVSSQVQDSIEEQTNIPVIELGALVFYSGNILIDLLLNFAFAIPEMIGLLLQGLLYLINIDAYMVGLVQIFTGVCFVVLYFIGLIQLLTGIRSGRIV